MLLHSEFDKNAARHDGLATVCKMCRKKGSRKRDMNRRFRLNRRFGQLKKNAKNRGIKVTINLEEYRFIMGEGTCYYCDASTQNETGAGLNRVDSKHGYEIWNVKPCCGKCNVIMNNYTKEDLRTRVYKIVKRMD
jgi:hypothetical protein